MIFLGGSLNTILYLTIFDFRFGGGGVFGLVFFGFFNGCDF